MKRLVERYSFNPAARTVTLNDCGNIRLEHILLITNVTDHILIYNFADTTLSGTLLGNVITLTYNTTSMSADDRLQIFVDMPDSQAEHLPCELSTWGNSGPLQQHEKESAQAPAQELLTYDTNLERVFGTNKLVTNDANRLRVEAQPAADLVFERTFTRANDELIVPVNGQATVGFQTFGTFSATVSFTASLDGQNWVALYARNMSVTGVVTSTTAASTFQASVAGFTYFRMQATSYTSGVCRIRAILSNSPHVLHGLYALGSQSTALVQKTSPYELFVYDTSPPANDALLYPDPWYTRQTYQPGDVVEHNGKIYRCIAYHVASGAIGSYAPPNTSYWQIVELPRRSLVTRQNVSAPDVPRLRIEHDLEAYQYRLQESILVTQRLQVQNDMIAHDYALTVSQDLGYANGKRFALGASGMSSYNFEEVR